MTTPKKAKPLRIAAGRYYKRSDGSVHGPAKPNTNYNADKYPWQMGGDYPSYLGDGRFSLKRKDSYDLLSEAPAPTPPSKPKPAARKLSGKAWAVVGTDGVIEFHPTREIARNRRWHDDKVIRITWQEA